MVSLDTDLQRFPLRVSALHGLPVAAAAVPSIPFTLLLLLLRLLRILVCRNPCLLVFCPSKRLKRVLLDRLIWDAALAAWAFECDLYCSLVLWTVCFDWCLCTPPDSDEACLPRRFNGEPCFTGLGKCPWPFPDGKHYRVYLFSRHSLLWLCSICVCV